MVTVPSSTLSAKATNPSSAAGIRTHELATKTMTATIRIDALA